jgi:hypothetical protein
MVSGMIAEEANVKTGAPPGRDWTVVLRRQATRIVEGQPEGGYTDAFELICCDCGDDPDLDYPEVALKFSGSGDRIPLLRASRHMDSTSACTNCGRPVRVAVSDRWQSRPGKMTRRVLPGKGGGVVRLNPLDALFIGADDEDPHVNGDCRGPLAARHPLGTSTPIAPSHGPNP